MKRSLLLTCALCVAVVAPLEGQIKSPVISPTIDASVTTTIQSLSVTDGVISLIGTHGLTVKLPDGTFKGPSGSSIIVVTGRIARYTAPTVRMKIERSGSSNTMDVADVKIVSGQVSLIGTHGVTTTLADGTFMSADGAKIVVQNRTIKEISAG